MNGQMDAGRGEFNLSLHRLVSTQWCPVVAVAYLSCPAAPTSSEAQELALHRPNSRVPAEVQFAGRICLPLSVGDRPQNQVDLGALGREIGLESFLSGEGLRVVRYGTDTQCARARTDWDGFSSGYPLRSEQR